MPGLVEANPETTVVPTLLTIMNGLGWGFEGVPYVVF